MRRDATKRGTSWPEICKVALRLPGVVKGVSYGTPALHVGKRFLARLKEDGETIAIKIDFSDRDVLLELDPEAFYLTDHYRPYPAMLVRLKQVRRGLLEEVIERAWRRQAPKSLVGRGPLGKPGSAGHGAATNDTAAQLAGRQRRRRSRTTRR